MTALVPSPATQLNAETRVLLVEDAASTRRFVRAALERASSTSGLVIVGEADSGRSALAAAARLRPDVVLLDLSLPDIEGRELLPELLRVAPAARIVVLSNNARVAGPALVELGATAFIEKGLPPVELMTTLLRILRSPVPVSGVAPADQAPVTARRAVICDDNPLVRRQVSGVLARCDITTVIEVVATSDVAATLLDALQMAGRSLVIVGDTKGSSPHELIAQLRMASPTSTFVAYSAETGPEGGEGGDHPTAFVKQPDLNSLERYARSLQGLARA